MIGFDTADMRGRANAKPRDIEKTEVFLKRKFDTADYLNAHPEAKAY